MGDFDLEFNEQFINKYSDDYYRQFGVFVCGDDC
jgi:hypothetical protein